MTDAFSLRGKVALVTGGTSGLGLAIATAFAACGATVVVSSRTADKIDAAITGIIAQHAGAAVSGMACDVADGAGVEAMFATLRAKLPKLDILVNAAGIINRTPSLDEPLATFDRVMKTNLYGTFACCQQAGRWMRETGGGSILNIASLTAHVALSDVAAYACSKAAVAQLTRNLASDWAQYGIRVNALSPGVFPTDINRAAISGTPRGDWMIKQTPMGRFGQASELAGAAVYLCSGAASFTTGAVLPVDGGFLACGVGPTGASLNGSYPGDSAGPQAAAGGGAGGAGAGSGSGSGGPSSSSS